MIELGDSRLPKRFWSKVDIDPTTDCWNWTAAKIHGYGRFFLDGQQRAAVRVAYEKLIGGIPDLMFLDHTCCHGSNRSCVNPEHTEPVTRLENLRRGGETRGSRRIRCRNGHKATAENTYMWRGWQCCRECRRDAHLRRRAAA